MVSIDEQPDESSLTLFGEARHELATAKRVVRYSPDLSEAARAIASAREALALAGVIDPGQGKQDELAQPATPLELRDQIDSLSRRLASCERSRRAGSPWSQRVRNPSLPAILALTASAALALAALAAQPPTPRPWRASYHAGLELAGKAVVRHQPRLDFAWERRSPVPGIDADRFSVRWDTCLTIPEEGVSDAAPRTQQNSQRNSQLSQLSFHLRSDDGGRLWLDDRLLVDSWKRRGPSQQSGAVPAAPGRHHLRVEYREQQGTASISLEIEEAGRRLEGERLSPPPEPFLANDPCRLAAGGSQP